MKNKLSTYIETLSTILLGLFFFTFPLIVSDLTTDNFALPKQFVLAGLVLVLLLFFGIKALSDRMVTFRRTPFDLPIALFILAVFVSSILAPNRSEALVSFTVLFFAALSYFLTTNFAKTRQAINLLIGGFIGGGAILSLLYILSFFKIYVLPFSFAKSQVFTPMGTLIEQAVYILVCLSLILYFAIVLKRNKFKIEAKPLNMVLLSLGILKTVILLTGFVLTIYALIKYQNPIILPFATGFQVAFAAISQDTSRAILSFLFGSGFGTFASDFARFKQVVFNQYQTLWNLTFFRSSSFVLELLTTTGILGLISYLFLVYKIIKQKPVFYPLVLLLVLSFLLPFSVLLQILLFMLLGIYSVLRGVKGDKQYFDVELGLVTLRNGLVAATSEDKKEVKHGLSGLLPSLFFLLVLILVGALGYFTQRYIAGNIIFQKSLLAAAQNNGSNAYQQQNEALQLFPYNDAYQRVFSQTNLALANSLSASIKNSSPSAQTTQTIYTLLQQSINSARAATTLSPQTAQDWTNLSSIYRSLIGVGKNADAFAILAAQQAALLDSTNPQEYINLGGLYFQLKLLDKAEEQFKIAINLKPDFANAYYNLAHTLQEKGDIQGAIDQLEQVKKLVAGDPQNTKKVQAEIDALKAGIKSTNKAPGAPTTSIPPQNPPIAIPAPTALPSPTPTSSPLTSPAPLK